MKVYIRCAAVLLASILLLSGCTTIGLGEKGQEEKRYTFGFTGMDLTDASFRAAMEELRAEVEGRGDTLLTFDPQLDNEKQIEGIENMLEEGIDLLVLGPVDVDGILPALKACRDAGVPVICYDSKVTDTEYIETFVGGDNYRLGRLIGEEILKDYPEGGLMGMLTNPLANSVLQREQGIRDALEGSRITIAACLDIVRYEEVLPQAEKILTEYPDINILWGLNDDITLLLHSSVLAAGREDSTALYGTGSLYHETGNDKLVEAVGKGYVRAVSLQEPAQWGILCGELGYRILNGEEVEDEYLGDSLIVNQENVREYEPEK